MLNLFQGAQILLNPREAKKLSIRDKIDIFFLDWGLMPLFIQESYLSSFGHFQGTTDLEKIADSAEYISVGDIISTKVVS